MVQEGLGITITTKRNYLSLPEQVVSRELKPNTFREINIAVLGKVHQKKRMPLSKRLVTCVLMKMLRYFYHLPNKGMLLLMLTIIRLYL